jgi:hypothetical protein
MTPFEALYGRKPPALTSYNRGDTKIHTLDEILTQKLQILQSLKQNLNRARNRMIQQANLHRKDKVFEVGQWVYLKLQPYRQISVHRRVSQKLAKRFYGPFLITKRIGPVAYELDLPPTARIHPVFHISMLKLCHGNPSTQISPIPAPDAFPPLTPEPIALLDHRLAANSTHEILIQWKGGSVHEATWEDLTSFKSQYPNFNLEDKIGLKGVCIDTTSQISPNSNMQPRPKREINKPLRYRN